MVHEEATSQVSAYVKNLTYFTDLEVIPKCILPFTAQV
jgi:hypothetical protein